MVHYAFSLHSRNFKIKTTGTSTTEMALEAHAWKKNRVYEYF